MMKFQDLRVGQQFKIVQSSLNWRPEIIDATWEKTTERFLLSGRYNAVSDSGVFPDTWLSPEEEVELVRKEWAVVTTIQRVKGLGHGKRWAFVLPDGGAIPIGYGVRHLPTHKESMLGLKIANSLGARIQVRYW